MFSQITVFPAAKERSGIWQGLSQLLRGQDHDRRHYLPSLRSVHRVRPAAQLIPTGLCERVHERYIYRDRAQEHTVQSFPRSELPGARWFQKVHCLFGVLLFESGVQVRDRRNRYMNAIKEEEKQRKVCGELQHEPLTLPYGSLVSDERQKARSWLYRRRFQKLNVFQKALHRKKFKALHTPSRARGRITGRMPILAARAASDADHRTQVIGVARNTARFIPRMGISLVPHLLQRFLSNFHDFAKSDAT